MQIAEAHVRCSIQCPPPPSLPSLLGCSEGWQARDIKNRTAASGRAVRGTLVIGRAMGRRHAQESVKFPCLMLTASISIAMSRSISDSS